MMFYKSIILYRDAKNESCEMRYIDAARMASRLKGWERGTSGHIWLLWDIRVIRRWFKVVMLAQQAKMRDYFLWSRCNHLMEDLKALTKGGEVETRRHALVITLIIMVRLFMHPIHEYLSQNNLWCLPNSTIALSSSSSCGKNVVLKPTLPSFWPNPLCQLRRRWVPVPR